MRRLFASLSKRTWIRLLLIALVVYLGVIGLGVRLRMKDSRLDTVSAAAAVASTIPTALGPCAPPTQFPLKVLRVIGRSRPAFTEGLIFWQGALYESTGLYGQSVIQRLDPISGRSEILRSLPADQFGEGLARWGADFLQLTWKQNVVWRWSFQDDGFGLAAVTLPYPREGWGITSGSDPENGLVASDGTSQLYFLNSLTFATDHSILVHDDKGPVNGLNELELVDGNIQPAIWANVWPSYRVVRIDPASGCVTGELDLTPLRDELLPADQKAVAANPDAVPNGIAYDAVNSSLYLTAKSWPVFFEIALPR
jgi:glutaminyl-peptide cyclotransferase